MRPAEVISVAFFATFVLAGLTVLSGARRGRSVAIGGAGIGIALLLPMLASLPGGAVIRDMVPSFLLLVGYWQTGQFVTRDKPELRAILERFDRRWLPDLARFRRRGPARSALSAYLQGAYMACYPIVPLGVAVLYLEGRAGAVDSFWLAVLPATYATHAMTTVVQTWPPWKVEGEREAFRDSSHLRSLNRWITNNLSIGANSFPSGHVASSFAVAFVLLDVLPLTGLVFLWIAVNIAVASVALRYHYGLDVILGMALAALSFGLLA